MPRALLEIESKRCVLPQEFERLRLFLSKQKKYLQEQKEIIFFERFFDSSAYELQENKAALGLRFRDGRVELKYKWGAEHRGPFLIRYEYRKMLSKKMNFNTWIHFSAAEVARHLEKIFSAKNIIPTLNPNFALEQEWMTKNPMQYVAWNTIESLPILTLAQKNKFIFHFQQSFLEVSLDYVQIFVPEKNGVRFIGSFCEYENEILHRGILTEDLFSAAKEWDVRLAKKFNLVPVRTDKYHKIAALVQSLRGAAALAGKRCARIVSR